MPRHDLCCGRPCSWPRRGRRRSFVASSSQEVELWHDVSRCSRCAVISRLSHRQLLANPLLLLPARVCSTSFTTLLFTRLGLPDQPRLRRLAGDLQRGARTRPGDRRCGALAPTHSSPDTPSRAVTPLAGRAELSPAPQRACSAPVPGRPPSRMAPTSTSSWGAGPGPRALQPQGAAAVAAAGAAAAGAARFQQELGAHERDALWSAPACPPRLPAAGARAG